MDSKTQSEYKIKQFPGNRFDMVGVSKKNCSDMITSSNNQSILIATHKHLHRLQYSEGKYNLSHVKISSKNEEEEFHLLEICAINKNESYIFICTRVEMKEINEVMVFRNDFKDLVDTIHLPFKPIVIKHIIYNDSIYTLFVGEAITALFVLTSQKDKKLSLVQIYDMPGSLSNTSGAVCIDYFIEKKQILHVAIGFFDGTIKMLDFPIETEDKQNEKPIPKFFTKQHTLQNETKLQLPISSVYFANMAHESDEEENMCLIAASSLGYLICFDNVIKNRLDEPIALPLKNESKLDTIMDCVVSDIDGDGQNELIAVTYLGDLFVIKKEESLKIIASKEIDACFFNVYVERHGDLSFIILCGDNETRIFEFTIVNK